MNVPAFLAGYPGDRHMLIVDVMVALHPMWKGPAA